MVSAFDPLACNRNLASSPNRLLVVARAHRGPPNNALAPRRALSAADDHQLDAPLPASIALLPSSGVHGTLHHRPYGKNVYQGKGLTPDAIRRFAPVAFKKIRDELRKRRDAGA